MPKVIKSQENKNDSEFPINHISASSMIKFSTNPILFKVQYINRDVIDTTTGITGIIGQAFHHAMEVYSGGSDNLIPTNEAEAIEYGLKAGLDYLNKYEDGFIKYSSKIQNKQKAFDIFSFAFNSYVKEKPYKPNSVISIEEEMIERIDIEWRGQRLVLPIKLKGYIDKIVREKGKLKIIDYKTCASFSKPDKIDGAKIIQAIEYYLLTYAKYQEEPYSVIFQEVKYTKNDDGGPQVQEYEIVFSKNDLYFDFYFRLYEDMINALNGKMVYVPNVSALYDNEVSIVAYINRLDIEETQAKLMEKHKVLTLTEVLKKEIHNSGNMKKLLKSIETNFVSAKNLNYEKMKNEDKIKTKLMEHGMVVQFDSLIQGSTVDLYRFMPTIGLKMSRIRSYNDDIEQVLGISGIRILAPIPNSNLIGFEVPRKERSYPSIPEGKNFDIAIGQTIMGEAKRFDLREAPHMLVAGSSGSGKSVFLNSVIKQLMRNNRVELHLFDPKKIELSHFKKQVKEYKTDSEDIVSSLRDIENEMAIRYDLMEKEGVRNIETLKNLNYKFVIIDEFGELISSKSEVENSILRLAQMARASGIHLIIATQRPSTDIIKGTIKANFPVKAVFKTSKSIDSSIIIDQAGAEKLVGKGDMLFCSDSGIERLQGYRE